MPEEQEREKLAQVIRKWNNNRLDLFEISQPDEVSRLFMSCSYLSRTVASSTCLCPLKVFPKLPN